MKQTENRRKYTFDPEKLRAARRRHLINIIILSVITLISLAAAALIVIWRLAEEGSFGDDEEILYTRQEVETQTREASSQAREQVLSEIRDGLEKGDSVLMTLRNVYKDQIVIMEDGQYYFYEKNRDLVKNPFKADDFTIRSDGFIQYDGDEDVTISNGVDVSAEDGDIEWDKVVEDKVSFAMIELGGRGDSGTFTQDSQFAANVAGAAGQDIDVGVIYDMNASSTDEASEDAQTVLDTISAYKDQITLPVAVHVAIPEDNDRTAALSADQYTKCVETFCEALEDAGYETEIFGETAAFCRMLDLEKLEEYGKWVADDDGELYFPYAFTCWQYSTTGAVGGISGEVNLDVRVSYTYVSSTISSTSTSETSEEAQAASTASTGASSGK